MALTIPPPRGQVLVVAEVGVNHDGDIEVAKEMISTAKDVGADAVKFQAYRTDKLVTKDARKADYQENATGVGSQYDMLKKYELSGSDLKKLSEHARTVGIPFFASHFDEDSLQVLVDLDVPVLKASSGELTDIPLLKKTASKKKPIILSTGMADEEEIARALAAIVEAGQPSPPSVLLLHAVSSYPCPSNEANLRAIPRLEELFGCPVGYSDHTEGDDAALAAVALGACMIEKHLTLGRSRRGPDHKASMEKNDFARMIRKIRYLVPMLGNGEKVPQPSEMGTREVARKSLVAAVDISAGTVLVPKMVSAKRPAGGIEPRYFWDLLGRVAKRDIPRDTLLSEGMFEA